MSGEQVRLQVPPKLYRVHSWITQIIRQWVPNCRSGDRKSPESRRCCAEHVEQTVDDVWQIADGDAPVKNPAFIQCRLANCTPQSVCKI